MSCSCCDESYNQCARKQVSCAKCDFDACKTCVRRFVLSTTANRHCMNNDCKVQWSQQFLCFNLNSSFVNGPYKQYISELLVQNEIAKLADSMAAADKQKQITQINTEQSENYKQIQDLLRHVTTIEEQQMALSTKKRKIRRETPASSQHFIMQCRSNDCRGFIGEDYSCGICCNNFCKDCLEAVDDGGEGKHSCNEDDVKSAEFIRSDTKGCPKCGVRIHKIDGCAQIWCTICQVAFDYNSGQIESINIHNPHFNQWMANQQSGAPPRDPEDIVCGGLVNYRIFRKSVLKSIRLLAISRGETFDISTVTFGEARNIMTLDNDMRNIYKSIAYVNNDLLYDARTTVRIQSDNEDLRVHYILKQISQDEMSTAVYKRKREVDFATDLMHVYETISAVGVEMINDLHMHCLDSNLSDMDDNSRNTATITQFENYAIYCANKVTEYYNFVGPINSQLKMISATYGRKVAHFLQNGAIGSVRGKISDIDPARII
jgi:hypothetical protein